MKDNIIGDGVTNVDRNISFLTQSEFGLSLIVFGLGLITIILQYLLLRKGERSAGEIMKVFVLTFIVIGSLLSITAGFTAESVAPIMGLFGTIAGYLLGRRSAKED